MSQHSATMAADMARQEAINAFYIKEDPKISEQARQILTEYSGIPEDQVVQHVKEIRDKAWKLFPYPCIGRYAFLEFSIAAQPIYPSILARLKDDDEDVQLLDLGCCFGQDLRRLIVDGAPASKLVATDLEAGFVDMGYDLFQDGSSLNVRFETGDFFSSSSSDGPNLEDGSFDFVHASSFFHLFNWDEQAEAMEKAVRLLKPKPGSLIFGRQVGDEEGKTVKFSGTRSGEMYQHSKKTFEKLVQEVADKVGKELRADVEEYWGKHKWWYMLRFTISLV